MPNPHAHSIAVPRPPILLAGLILAAASLACTGAEPWQPADGDLVFQVSTSAQSGALERATGSRWTHVGLVFHRRGEPWVLEAVATVRAVPLPEWIERGRDGRWVAMRLRPEYGTLDATARQRMLELGRWWLGERYDPAFRWSDDRLYCSELVWKLYARAAGVELCPLRRTADFDLDEQEVVALAEQRGGLPPADEPVVAPSDLMASDRLVVVGRS